MGAALVRWQGKGVGRIKVAIVPFRWRSKDDIDLVSLKGVAERCGVAYITARNWRNYKGMPPPDFVVDDKPLWLWDTVVDWLHETGRQHYIE